MKKLFFFLASVSSLLFTSCAYDNYDGPDAQFKGRIVYQGNPIGVRGYNDVYFQLWEPGWKLKTSIDVPISPAGTFSATLFSADYKLIIPNGQGPFRTIVNAETGSDTLLVNLRGSMEMDIEVMPYYIITGNSFAKSATTIDASVSLEKIITDINAKDIERVVFYLGKTSFTDDGQKLNSVSINGADIVDINDIDLSLSIPTVNQQSVFGRVAVKIVGVEDMLFGAAQKIDL